jgi:hypothetical protein
MKRDARIASATNFDQPDLGYARDNPELYQDKWHALEARPPIEPQQRNTPISQYVRCCEHC